MDIKSKTHGKKILEVLHDQHEEVMDVLKKILDSSSSAVSSRKNNFSKLRELLYPHMQGEENLVYPYIRDRTDDKDPIYEAVEEHYAARAVLSDAEDTDVSDETWHAKIKVLHELLDHHIEEEESVVFSLADKVMDRDQARELADQYEMMTREVTV